MVIAGIVIGLIVMVWAVLILRLLMQRTSYAAYWQARADQTLSQDALIYVALGDSAAQGLGANHPEKSYVGIFADNLKLTSGRPVHVINLSVSGAKTTDLIRDQLPKFKLLNLPSDAVVTLEIGANNMVPDFAAPTFETEMNQIIAALPPQTIVADIPYFGDGRKRNMEPTVEIANKIMSKAIAANNLRQAHLFDQTKNFGSWRDYAPDFLHPNNHGYANWAKAFLAIFDTK